MINSYGLQYKFSMNFLIFGINCLPLKFATRIQFATTQKVLQYDTNSEKSNYSIFCTPLSLLVNNFFFSRKFVCSSSFPIVLKLDLSRFDYLIPNGLTIIEVRTVTVNGGSW